LKFEPKTNTQGYGESSLQLLPGRIGSLDVDDCISALKAAADRGLADASRAAAVGGSHGGFLAANLLGLHPSLFRAGVLRNPVLDLSLMAAVSDIPEWAFVEAWGGREGRRRARARPDAEDLARFAAVSPIAHVDKVTAPLLVLLGGKDRRVPLEDASRYLCALRGRRAGRSRRENGTAKKEEGEEDVLPPPPPRTRVLVFPNDAHALDAPQTEFEAWLNAAAWLKEHVV
jgi:acylaminoacyl-peptidase